MRVEQGGPSDLTRVPFSATTLRGAEKALLNQERER